MKSDHIKRRMTKLKLDSHCSQDCNTASPTKSQRSKSKPSELVNERLSRRLMALHQILALKKAQLQWLLRVSFTNSEVTFRPKEDPVTLTWEHPASPVRAAHAHNSAKQLGLEDHCFLFPERSQKDLERAPLSCATHSHRAGEWK